MPLLNQEQRNTIPVRERRFLQNLEVRQKDGKTCIRGYAAKFNTLSLPLGGFVETIKPGAFANAILTDDVRALVGHDPDKIIGRNKAGTLMLREDDQGLYTEIYPPETQVGRDVVASIKRGDLDGMSFGFSAEEDDWSGTTPQGERLREVRKAKLYDVSVVTYPAYPQTEVGVREYRTLLFPEGEPTPAATRGPMGPTAGPFFCDHEPAKRCIRSAHALHRTMFGTSNPDPEHTLLSTYMRDAYLLLGGNEDDLAESESGDMNGNGVGDGSGDLGDGGSDDTMRTTGKIDPRAERKTKKVAGVDLTSDCFAYVGDKDKTETWKLPIKFPGDEAKTKSHIQNALARFNQTEGIPEGERPKVLAKIKAAAKAHGIHVSEEKAAAFFQEYGQYVEEIVTNVLDKYFLAGPKPEPRTDSKDMTLRQRIERMANLAKD